MEHQRLSNRIICDLCQGLSLLLHSGIGAGDALTLLAEEEPDPSLRTLLAGMAQQVDDGTPLALALRGSGRFPPYVCGLVEVGEQAGRMEESLSALAQHYEARIRLDHRLRSALLYPSILMLMMLAVIAVLLVQVLPVFNEVYSYFGGRLTGVAAGLLALGQALDRAMPFLCVLLAGALLFLLLFFTIPGIRERVLSAWRSRWGDRGLSQQLNTARLAQSLSLGLRSGLAMEEALSLSAALMEHIPAAKLRCLNCLERLDQGEPLVQALGDSDLLPKRECRLLDLGIQSGSGDATMDQIACRLTEESEAALDERVGQVEPALVASASLLVGLILLSVMLPLLQILSAIG